ncbi:MAG: DUF3153 domain-containing protein [Cyanobacteriota bacterium]|nr:DUF3153 domain-containing protein [Cyanobacteriota bacterium]
MDSPSDPLSSVLAEAKTAIARGEYGRAVRLLEPLCEHHSPVHPPGDSLRLLLATAWMGLGEGERAIACCRSLLGCADARRRARARELLQVLEAPALRRPREWSLTLPRLDQVPPLEGIAPGGARSSSRRKEAEAPPPPPVGPTRSPRGFVALVVAVLVVWLLGTLLSGCMRVETELAFAGPGRVRLSHRLEPTAGAPLPFQRRLADALAADRPPYAARTGGGASGAVTQLTSPLLTLAEAEASLARTLEVAAAQTGITLPAPTVELRETNWLLGVRQRARIRLDLRSLPPLPGLGLSLRLSPLGPGGPRRAEPLEAIPVAGSRAWVWPLRPGRVNALEVQAWRWNPLGLGALAILAVLALVVQVQRMRVRLGLGLPELPG